MTEQEIERARYLLKLMVRPDGRLDGPIATLSSKGPRGMGIGWERALEIVQHLEGEGFVLPRSADPEGYHMLATL